MAIEFAALFLLFFAMVYSIIAYSIPVLLFFTFSHLTAEATRAAVKVVPNPDESAYRVAVSREVSSIIATSWLPHNWIDGNCPPPGDGAGWQALPASNGHPSFGHIIRHTSSSGFAHYYLHVCIQRKYGAAGNAHESAIIPLLRLGDLTIPPLPMENGTPIIRRSSITQL